MARLRKGRRTMLTPKGAAPPRKLNLGKPNRIINKKPPFIRKKRNEPFAKPGVSIQSKGDNISRVVNQSHFAKGGQVKNGRK